MGAHFPRIGPRPVGGGVVSIGVLVGAALRFADFDADQGAQVALIVGDDEAATGTVAIKPLRSAGNQIAVPEAQVPGRLASLSQ